ncbi:hypothetical protein O988_02868, partial [Pseudogymnoascus sp. VKM F-3808]
MATPVLLFFTKIVHAPHLATATRTEKAYFGPKMSSRIVIDAHGTLQGKWLQLLRTRRGPSAPLLKCPYCHDPPKFTDENDLWHHVKKTHSVHIPRDESRVKRFRDEVLAKSRALS